MGVRPGKTGAGPGQAPGPDAADPGSQAAGGGARHHGRRRAAPFSLSVGLPGLTSHSRTTRLPVTPMPDEPVRTGAVASARPLSARAQGAALRRAERGFARLQPLASQEPDQPTSPATSKAMLSLDGFLDELQTMFHGELGTNVLALRLLGAVPKEAHGDAPYIGPLVLATALRSAGATTILPAIDLIFEAGTGAATPEVLRLERVLASTAAGTRVLARLRRLDEQSAQLESLRDQLNLGSALERHGVKLDGRSTVEDIVADLEAHPGTRMHAPIGQADDAPLQLLSKALRHALAREAAGPAAPEAAPGDRAAFVAWKQGGFETSVPGSDFDNAIGRLHKFTTYVRRAEHGPRTLAALLRDAGSAVGRAVGVGKSPLSAMRHGTLGGDRGLLHEDAARVRERLERALGVAVDDLLSRWRTAAGPRSELGHAALLSRAAVLDLWRETGRTQHAERAVVARARDLAAHAGSIPDETVLARSLRGFTRRVRGEASEPMVRVGLRALEAVAVDRSRWWGRADATAVSGTAIAPAPAERRELLKGLLAELRSAREVDADAKPLFKLSDLRRILRGAPREGPTAADARRVMKSMADAPRVAFSDHSDGHRYGIGALGVLALRVGSLVGTPMVYPVLGLEGGRTATVSVGQYTTGGRLFVGTETSRSGTLGAGGGWVAPPMAAGLVTALAVGQASIAHDQAHAEGLAITVRNDRPGAQGKLGQVLDFLFDQARGDAGKVRADTAAGLWQRYAERFGDDPHLGLSWVTQRGAARGASVGATAVVRVAAGPDTSIGPGASVGAGIGGSRLERRTHADGGDVPLVMHGRQGSVSLAAGISQTVPFAPIPGADPLSGWGAGLPLVGASLAWRAPGGLGIARVGRDRDGSVSAPLTQREIVFTEARSTVEYIQRRRVDWEAAMVAQDDTGATGLREARARLNTFIEQALAADSPRALHGELVSLAPAVAQHINALEARATTILGRGDRAAAARRLTAEEQRECLAVQNEVQQLLNAESSWMPVALYSAETQSRSHSVGPAIGLRLSSEEQAGALHVTALLVAARTGAA